MLKSPSFWKFFLMLILPLGMTGRSTIDWTTDNRMLIGDSISLTLDTLICEGMVFTWNNIDFIEDSLICENFLLPNGCDSTFCWSLKVVPEPLLYIDVLGDFCDQDEVVLSTEEYETYLWSTGESTQSIQIFEPGIYSLTVTNQQGCTAVEEVIVDQAISYDVFFTPPSCPGERDGIIEIVNAPGGAPPLLFSIDNGAHFFATGLFDGLGPGTYQIVVEGMNGCRKSVSLLLNEPMPFAVEAGADQFLVAGEQTRLMVETDLANPSINWTPAADLDCTSCANPLAQPEKSTLFVVAVSDVNGCMVKDSLWVNVGVLTANVYQPTAFSPNGDGRNDYFNVLIDDSFTGVHSLKIFNRWGGLMYEGFNLENSQFRGWDGRTDKLVAEAGVYTYLAELMRIDGKIVRLKGAVQLLK